MNRNGKKIWIPVLLTLAVILTAVGWAVYEAHLDTAQRDAIALLERDEGRYDPQTIVLQDTSAAEAKELAELYGATLRITENGRFATLTLPEGSTITDVYSREESREYINAMSADYYVQVSELEEAVSERLPVRTDYPVEDDGFPMQGYLDYLNIGVAWYNNTGYNVTVAVIDSGIDTDHPEFAGKISEYSYNATEDKIVKDFNDWSLIEDEYGHGTSVTGVIAASMDGSGIVGVAPNVEILVIKAECIDGRFNGSDLLFGIYYAIERDVDVMNMSFGTYGENPYADVLKLAYDSDIICVAAAGNDGTSRLSYPAADPHVIGVGALADNSWELADYSNYGENTDVVAPGTTYTTAMGGGYKTETGTSLAAPLVAGVLALYTGNHGYLSVDQVMEYFHAACDDLGEPGRDWYYGFGIVDTELLLSTYSWDTVTFDMLTDELENQKQVHVDGKALQELPEPERLYAIFDGWYYDDAFTQEYEFGEVLAGEVTLYAKWVNEEDGIPFTYVTLDDGTVEIRSYTGHRRYITVPAMIEGKTVSSIGDRAFAGETRLREVTLPEGLTNIGEEAFYGCSNLISIKIPKNVRKIGNGAFIENIRLRTVAFEGNQLETIGRFAFSYSAIDRIELPASVTSVDGSAFYGTMDLRDIRVQSGNEAYISKDGVLFNKDVDTVLAYPAAKGTFYDIPDGTVTVGDYAFGYAGIYEGIDLSGVQSIGEAAFSYSKLLSVVIPDSVTEMGSGAFKGCVTLSYAQIGAGLQVLPTDTFGICSSLRQIDIPDTITEIQSTAFFSSGLNTVNFGENSQLQLIGAAAFKCSNLVQIEIPASVEIIDYAAFYNTPLRSITFAEESALTALGAEAFSNCGCLSQIELPESLEFIGKQCFYNTALHNITIPAAVTQIGDGVFGMCSNLEAITVEAGNPAYHDIDGVLYNISNTAILAYPSAKTDSIYTLENTVQDIRPYAFAGTPNLNTVYMPDTLTFIGSNAFSASLGLQWLNIPNSVVEISRNAFSGSWNLESVSFYEGSQLSRISIGAFANCGITSITIPANVSTMAQGVFEGCDRLNEVYFAGGSKLKSISAYMFDGAINLWNITFEQGSALKHIQAHAFEGMTALRNINFGDAEIEEVDNFAFRFCSSLDNLSLPETVKSIGRNAFYGCKSLSKLTLPTDVEHIGSYAFHNTGDMELYMLSENLPEYLDENWDYGLKSYYTGVTEVMQNDEYRYAVLTSGNIAIIEYLGNATSIDLTKVNLGGNIVTIGGSALEGSDIESILLPETLTQIQAEAFRNTKLKEISIPASVDFIGREAFAYSTIETITFAADSKLKVIEQYAFSGTKNLKRVTIPASVTTMGTGVFENSGLTGVNFEEGIALTEIPQKAFVGTKLESIKLPDSITLVNHNAFQNVQTLKSVQFGKNDGIRLMSNAFYHTGLTEVHIPSNVTYIGEYCFVALRDLTGFTIDADHPNYTVNDGLLLTKDGRKLIAVPAGRTGKLEVPLSVEEIGFGAFEESELSEVTFHKDSNILSLGYRAFFRAGNITSITIPKSVVAIDYYAFAYCENLKEVNFAEGNQLKGIYEGAFCGDIALEEIEIPDAVVEISDWAFYGCTKIDRIPVSENTNLKGIYDYAFAYTGLNGALATPENLTDIGAYAFAGNKFTSVTVPSTNAKDLMIGIGAFEGCNKLESITLPFIGASFEDDDIPWFGYIFGAGSPEANSTYVPQSLQNVTISEGITYVGAYAFYELEGFDLDLPKSVSGLELFAFDYSSVSYELENEIRIYYSGVPYEWATDQVFGSGISGHLKLANGITEISINQCPGLTQITAPDTVKRFILSGSGITELVLPDSVTYFQLHYSEKLRSVKLPDGIASIPEIAFLSCYSLTSVDIPESVTNIGDNAFFYCTALTDLVLPDNITSIGEYAFQSCFALKRIQLSANLRHIGTDAFRWLDKLVEIDNRSTLPLTPGSEDYGYVAQNAKLIIDRNGNKLYREGSEDYSMVETTDGFRFILEGGVYTLIDYIGSDSTITLPRNINGQSYSINQFVGGDHIIIPEGLTSISEYAFEGNTTVKKITVPDSVTYIGRQAFAGCTQLREVTLPANLEGITDFLFSDCENLQQLTLPENLRYIHMEPFARTAITALHIPASVEQLSSYSFAGLSTLDLTVDSESIHYTVRDDILYSKDLSEIIFAPKHITSVELPAEVTFIGGAFENCTELKTVTFAENSELQTIGARAFSNCVALENIELPNTVETIQGTAFMDCHSLKQIVLPASLQYLGELVFYGCENITKINLPAGVAQIDPTAFDGMSNLEEIHLQDGSNSFAPYDGILYTSDFSQIVATPTKISGHIDIHEGVTTIGWGQFEGCDQITSITLPQTVTRIEANAFHSCASLESINLPDSITYIGDYAFYGCRSLRTVKLPSKLETLSYAAFADCVSLSEVIFPEGLTTIGSSSFSHCLGLTSIEFPSTLTLIEPNAFAGASGLVSVEFPEGLTEISRNAFQGATHLVRVTLPSSLTQIGENAFVDCYQLREIYNNSNLDISFGSADHGAIAQNAYMIVDKVGNKTYRDGKTDSGVTFTEDGFVFVDYEYSSCLIAYVGEEDTVTLPTTFNGKAYQLADFCGAKHVIIPDTITEIPAYAFSYSSTLESVTLHDNIRQIGWAAFMGCKNLLDATLPDSLDYLGGEVFGGTRIYDELVWQDGGLYKDGYLLKVDPEVEYFTVREDTRGVAEGAFSGCTKLIYLRSGAASYNTLFELSNLQTLVITGGDWNFENIPLTLQNIVLTESVVKVPDLLGLSGVTIYTEIMEDENRWGRGWNYDCRVLYQGKWIMVSFYDQNGELMYMAPQSSSAIVRPPYVELPEDGNTVYNFLGWSVDGDDIPDSLPATSAIDITAHAVVEILHTHNYTATVTAPTCTAQGYTTHICNCGDSYVDSYTAILPHEMGSWEWIKEATCTEAGEKTRRCANCTHSEAETFASLGHLLTSYYSDANATCETDGTKTAYCDRECGYRETVADPGSATGHSYSAVVTSPTCTTQGYTIYICHCGNSYTDDYTNVLDHEMGSWEWIKEATCTEAGEKTRRCANCTYSEAETVDALGHDYKHGLCSRCDEADPDYQGEPGDLNDDGEVTDADAIYLLYATFDPDSYPLYGNADYNGDGEVTDADAIYLLYATFDPAGYPLS